MSGGCKDLTRPTPIIYILRYQSWPEGLIQRLSSGRIHPCKDQTYSHSLCFKITELARGFNQKTVLRQDTLLLYSHSQSVNEKKGMP